MLKPATYYYFFSFVLFLLISLCRSSVGGANVSPEGDRGAFRSSARKRYQTEIRSFMYIYKYINSYTVYRARVNGTALGF